MRRTQKALSYLYEAKAARRENDKVRRETRAHTNTLTHAHTLTRLDSTLFHSLFCSLEAHSNLIHRNPIHSRFSTASAPAFHSHDDNKPKGVSVSIFSLCARLSALTHALALTHARRRRAQSGKHIARRHDTATAEADAETDADADAEQRRTLQVRRSNVE